MTISKRLLGVAAVAVMIVAACGPGGAGSGAPSVAAINWKACVAFDTGGLGDKGFNDLAKKGLEDAAKLGYKTAFAEARNATDYEHNIQTLIDQKCQTIITVGFLQGKATAKATLANPTIGFGQVDAAWDPTGPDGKAGTADDPPKGIPANFSGLDYQVDQASMLAGYLAAGFSKSGKIGTFGGLAFPGVTRFMDGLYAGIKYYNEKKSKTVTLLGWDGNKTGTFVGGSGSTDTWNDPSKGEQFAKTFLDQGVDIVHPVAGETGNGTIKAMLAAGKWAIGVDNDQSLTLPAYAKAILTSAQKAIDVSVVEVIKKNQGGDLGGEDYSGTLANKGVLLSPFHDFDSVIPAELKTEIDALSKAISDGSVKVCTYLARGC